MSFVIITKEEFESYLFEGFEQVPLENSKEFVYQMDSDKGGVAIRVYSSVDVRTNKTRDYGTDAVRVVFWDTLNDRPIGKGKRINRVEKETSIGDRIRIRISSFMNSAKDQNVQKIDNRYVESILIHPVVRDNYFAQQLLDKFKKFGKLTDGQLDCILGERSSKGRLTLEAQIKKKFPLFGVIEPMTQKQKEEEEIVEEVEDDEPFTDDILDLYEEKTAKRMSITENVDVEKRKSTKKYKHHKYPFDLFNPVQTAVIPHMREDKNMVIGANTSAGKTVCAELLMDYVLRQRR